MSFLAEHKLGSLGALVLGTVQLGLPYGIANRTGQPSSESARAILDTAYACSIRVLDTAQAYGNSEAIIGQYRRAHPEQHFHVVSKLDPALDHLDSAVVTDAVRHSVSRTGGPLAGIMLHDPSKLAYWKSGVGRNLLKCQECGLVEALGVSVYTPQEFERAVEIAEIRMIQAPFSALDQRLRRSGLLDRAIHERKLVFLRSIFLQGLLLMDPEHLSEHLQFARKDLAEWHELCRAHRVSPAIAALKYVHAVAPACGLVVGCERPEQVQANVDMLRTAPLTDACVRDIDTLRTSEQRMLNPSLWHDKA